MVMSKKNVSRVAGRSAAAMVEDVVGCKWTLRILGSVRAGQHRPGQIRAAHAGLSNKVLQERLRKLQRFGILTRTAFPEVPPRVEYRLTPYGRRFARLLRQVDALQAELDRPV